MAQLAALPDLELKVFYLWDFGVVARTDPGFGETFTWDLPLLEGYASEFIPNVSPAPGTEAFGGLHNPGLVAALGDWRPDAILMMGYAYRSHLDVLLSPRLRKVPMLLRGDSHDLARPANLRTWAARQARRLLFRRFSGFLAVGRANADYFRRSGVPEDRIVFAPHAVDNARFRDQEPATRARALAWRRELGIPDGAFVFLFAGKLEDKKRPQDLLAAFAALEGTAAPRPAALLFVGSGAWESRLKAEAGSRLGKTVFFAPFQNQPRMPMVYAAGDVLVLPSLGPSETWGLAVNEAMNLGLPAIVSSHVGCGPDLIEEGRTGWRFPAGDVAALSSALRQALEAGDMAFEGLREAARVKVASYAYGAATAALRDTLERLGLLRPGGGR
jgi:glycosyltransferase involved in cell wall biosynthesis